MVSRTLCLAAAGACLAVASPAKAWDPASPDASCTAGGKAFSGPPAVVVHTAEIDGFGLAEFFQMLQAISDIHDVVGDVADTSLAITSSSFSSDPFTYQTWYGDTTPTIHVGFSSSAPFPARASRNTSAACTYDEAHIEISNQSIYPWSLGEPEAEGVPYWDAGKWPGGLHSFRLMYLHELWHTFGVAHSDHSFSIMNKVDRPWHNRPAGEQFQPLPDDVEAIRELYPDSRGDSFHIALLNTWHDLADPIGDAISHKMLCRPSIGNGWADFWDASRLVGAAVDDGLDTCGTPVQGDGTDVCPGDTLRTRVAIANYDTQSVDMALRLWFSADDVWDGVAGGDVRASEVRNFTVNAEAASLQGRLFTVPDLAEGEYYVIAKGVATDAGGSKVNDWIPLRGTVTVLPPLACGN